MHACVGSSTAHKFDYLNSLLAKHTPRTASADNLGHPGLAQQMYSAYNLGHPYLAQQTYSAHNLGHPGLAQQTWIVLKTE